MRLVFLLENDRFIGGADYSLLGYAKYLAQMGHHVTVFAKNKIMNQDELQKYMTIFTRGALKRYFKGWGTLDRIYDHVYTAFVVKKYLSSHPNIDFLIGYLTEAAIKAVALGKQHGIRTVNFVYESPPWMEKDLHTRWLEEYKGKFRKLWQLTKKAYLASNILISSSRISQLEAEKWLRSSVTAYVYPSIEFRDFEKSKVKERTIVYVGRLDRYKNVHVIINALSAMEKPPVLNIIGKGPEYANLVRLAKSRRVLVNFLGALSDKEKYRVISSSRFMVFPSSHEGFGMPPMEALASGIPCVCTNKPIFREVYGDHIEYFKEQSENDLRKKMDYLLSNPQYCQRGGKQGRKFVVQEYGLNKSAKKIEGILIKYLKS